MKKTIILTIALIGVQFLSHAQRNNGYLEYKVFLGYTNVGGKSGVEYQNEFRRSDLFSWGSQFTLLLNANDKSDAESFEKTFKFLDSMDGGGFVRFHFTEALNLRENVDPYLGADFTVRSLGVHLGLKYNFSETVGLYAMYKQSFSSSFMGDTKISEEEGEYTPSYFGKKAALSVGVTFRLFRS
ncbi:hypothetical protein SAMN05421741_103122 [Paenimyroides ummariense]|uniref:Outer membrane protein beta-barrel domain-containing protein n=1 Tax=Paenimyroides ummariense TaxID=913024 RepID=A0A1I4XSW1_9FLAO|nr:DUF6646 family protein [Paenimyroides ummariense]SFN28935.1 hypothetical protein SAMN05421741_103122 [Paenimyroides ummariense]